MRGMPALTVPLPNLLSDVVIICSHCCSPLLLSFIAHLLSYTHNTHMSKKLYYFYILLYISHFIGLKKYSSEDPAIVLC